MKAAIVEESVNCNLAKWSLIWLLAILLVNSLKWLQKYCLFKVNSVFYCQQIALLISMLFPVSICGDSTLIPGLNSIL